MTFIQHGTEVMNMDKVISFGKHKIDATKIGFYLENGASIEWTFKNTAERETKYLEILKICGLKAMLN